MAVISVEHLNKSFKVKEKEKGFCGSMKAIIKPKYKEVHAVNDISFSVEEGEVIAFIGPNGAGKSTTIKMLTGILYPDSGNIEVLGIMLLLFVIEPVVSLIIDVAISLKEVVFNSDIFVVSNLLVVIISFSLVDIDCVELFEVRCVVSSFKVVVSNRGLVEGLLIWVVSILEVLNNISGTFVVSFG